MAFTVGVGKCQRAPAKCANTDGTAVSAVDSCSCGDDFIPVAKDAFCRVEAKQGYSTPKKKCVKADASAKEAAICSCGTKTIVEVPVDGFCYEAAGVGYAYTAKMCAKTDGSADEAAACMCGTNKQAIAINKVAYIAAGGTTCAEKNKLCAKSDGSAAEAAACSCGPDLVAVANTKICRVVAKKGYETAKVKCSSTDGSAAVTAACTCGYKTTMADAAVGKFCYEASDGKGYVTDTKQCSALNAKQADGSTIASAACTCGITTQATTCGFCFDDAAYVGKAAMSACSKTDGSAAHAKAPERCICDTDACEVGKFCFAASANTGAPDIKCRATALAACGAGKEDGSTAATADCQCGTVQAL